MIRVLLLASLFLASACAQTRVFSKIAFFEPSGRLAHGEYFYYPLKVSSRKGFVAVLDGSPNLGFRNSRVLLFNKSTGVFAGSTEIPRGAEKGAKGSALFIDERGRIYVAVEDVGRTHLLRLTPGPHATFQQEWDPIGGGSYPTGLAVGPGETIYLVDAGNHRIIRMPWKGFDPMVIGKAEDLETPRGIAVDTQGSIFTHVIRQQKLWVLKYAPDGKLVATFLVPGVEEPLAWFFNDLAVDSMGRIYLTDYAKSRVLVLNDKGEVVQELKNPAFKGPMGLSFDDDESLYIADAWAKEVFHFRPVREDEAQKRAKEKKPPAGVLK